MGKRTSGQDALDRAAAILREHFGHAVVVIADGDTEDSFHLSKFVGNASCCRGLLSDAFQEEFNPGLEIEIEKDDDEETETE